MSRAFFRRNGLLMTALTGMAVVSACTDMLGPDSPLQPGQEAADLLPPGRTGIEVIPGGPLDLLPGDTVTIRVEARDTRAIRYTYVSSDTLVATITGNGLITALKPGDANIGIRLADGSLRITTNVRVASRGPARIDFLEITEADSASLSTDSVAGRVRVGFRVQRGNAVALRVQIDTVTLCTSRLPRTAPGQPTGEEEVYCLIDTAAHDSIAGIPLLKNGPVTLGGSLVSSSGVALARSDGRGIRLANRDTILTRLIPQRSAEDRDGRRWIGGDVAVEALPLFFSPAERTASINFTYQPPASGQLSVVDDVAPYRIVLPYHDLVGIVDPSFSVKVVTRKDSGITVSGVSADARYDGRAPGVGSLQPRTWFGSTQAFSDSYIAPMGGDPGVGIFSVRFYAGRAGDDAARILDAGDPVRFGGDLRESGEGEFRLAYRACDALENCVNGTGFTFGVDLRPPTVIPSPAAGRQINLTGDLRFAVSDDRSGISATPLEVAVTSLLPGGSSQCGPDVAGAKLPGVGVPGRCAPEAVGVNVPVPMETEGYYFYRVTAVDRAENRSQVIEQNILVDHQAPTITALQTPSTLQPGENFNATAAATDNVDLASVAFNIRFGSGPTSTALPFAPTSAVGTPFSGRLSREAEVTARMPFVRTLTTIAGQRSTYLATAIEALATDAAGFTADRVRPLSAEAFGGNVSIADPFLAVRSFEARVASTSVCAVAPCEGQVRPLSAALSVTGDSGLSPFVRVYLLARGADGKHTVLAASSTFAVVETGTQRRYTYSFEHLPDGSVRGAARIFGVALSGSGNALKSAEVPVEFVGP